MLMGFFFSIGGVYEEMAQMVCSQFDCSPDHAFFTKEDGNQAT